MDSSLNIPSERRLSNSIIKNRPKPNPRRKKEIHPTLRLDDTVPLDGK